MTSSEFRAACERLGLSADDAALQLGLSLDRVVRIENGAAGVPRRVARELAWRVTMAERTALLEASGLPPCPEVEGLLAAISGSTEVRAQEAAHHALARHLESCGACGARQAYAREHLPPAPVYPAPWWMRLAYGFLSAAERLPRGIRPPEGPAGAGRRAGIFVAVLVFVSAVLPVIAIGAVVVTVRGGWSAFSWRELVLFPLILPAYLAGFFLAGAAFDATRHVGDRFVGYVLRGALGAAAVIGACGVLITLLDEDVRFWPVLPVATLVCATFGGLVGAGMWVRDRLRGRLTRRPA